MAEQNPKFDEELEKIHQESGLRISPSLGEPLGGDITFAVDGPLLPLPSWKIVAEVYSPDKMQWTIDQLIAAVNKNSKCENCSLHATAEQVGDKTFHIISSDRFSYEIDYVFVDGYLVRAQPHAAQHGHPESRNRITCCRAPRPSARNCRGRPAELLGHRLSQHRRRARPSG